MKAVNTARLNVKAAGLSNDITVEQQDFKDFKKPQSQSLIVMNPPYGERISTPNLLGTYRMIGERLKHEFGGNEAWILSYKEECFEQIGLKPSIKTPLYNGSLECELRKYTLFEGKMKAFRSEGGIVKTDDEKREMAPKHRFKKNREFKQRIENEEANEEGDIRTFKFHSFESKLYGSKERESYKGRENRKNHDDSWDSGSSKSRGGFKKRDDFKGRNDFKPRGGKGFKGGNGRRDGQKFGKNRRFQDED